MFLLCRWYIFRTAGTDQAALNVSVVMEAEVELRDVKLVERVVDERKKA